MIKHAVTPRFIVGTDDVKTDIVLPLSQYEQFIRQYEKLVTENAALTARLEVNERMFFYRPKGASARARCFGPCWVVLKDSTASMEGRSLPDRYWDLQKELLEKGILVKSEGFYRFTEDCVFDNPSAAACVVENGSRDGYDAWKDKDGISLGRYREELKERNKKGPA